MLSFGAEGTDVAWAVVDEAVADHFVLAFEAFAAFGAGAACDWAVVRAVLAVDVLVRAGSARLVDWLRICIRFALYNGLLQKILRLESASSAVRNIALVRSK